MFEDQVLLAKIYLTTPIVCSAATTALYRIHEQSSTALAERSGTYNPVGPNEAELRYLTWLRGRPEVAGDEDLAELVDDRLEDCGGSTLVKQRYLWARRRIMYSLPDRTQAVVKRVRAPGSKKLIRPGLLKRVQPVSRDFGYERGEPIDRYYISAFLGRHRHQIRGRVLEIGDDSYTKEFGGSQVTHADIFSAPEAPGPATWRGDLATAHDIPDDLYDCIVITQTLQFLRDVPGTLANLHRILKPGGVVLATVPGLSAIADVDWNFTWHWLFAPLGAKTLFADEFGERNVDVSTWGNVASAASFLYGLAVDELNTKQLDVHDEQYPVIISIRAGKPVR
jgi:SAM-dependent methyltransferase